MSRTLPVLTAVILALSLVSLAACDGDARKKSTQTPAETTTVETPTGPTGAAPTRTATLTPVGHEFSASATASAKVGDKSLTFENGTCVKGPNDAWLGVSMGEVGTAEYFLLVVGNLTGQEGLRSAKAGGVFTGDEITAVTGAQSGTTFSMGSSEQDKVITATDLRSGEFTGTAADGQPVSGSFEC